MKNLIFVVFLLCFAMSTNAIGDDYIGEELPSVDLIASYASANVDDYIGNYKHSDDKYTVFFAADYKIIAFTLIRLNTNRWLVEGREGKYYKF